jgi:hypothetical protein
MSSVRLARLGKMLPVCPYNSFFNELQLTGEQATQISQRESVVR